MDLITRTEFKKLTMSQMIDYIDSQSINTDVTINNNTVEHPHIVERFNFSNKEELFSIINQLDHCIFLGCFNEFFTDCTELQKILNCTYAFLKEHDFLEELDNLTVNYNVKQLINLSLQKDCMARMLKFENWDHMVDPFDYNIGKLYEIIELISVDADKLKSSYDVDPFDVVHDIIGDEPRIHFKQLLDIVLKKYYKHGFLV